MKGEIVIQKRKFDCFDVYFSAEGHSFVYADFKDNDSFIDGLVEYIFKEETCLITLSVIIKLDLVEHKNNMLNCIII